MHAKLFYKLQEVMEQFISKNAETPEYECENMLTPDNLALHMTKAASAVFDATAESSRFTKENAV